MIPVGKDVGGMFGGDIGFELAGAFTAVTFPIFRYFERKYIPLDRYNVLCCLLRCCVSFCLRCYAFLNAMWRTPCLRLGHCRNILLPRLNISNVFQLPLDIINRKSKRSLEHNRIHETAMSEPAVERDQLIRLVLRECCGRPFVGAAPN